MPAGLRALGRRAVTRDGGRGEEFMLSERKDREITTPSSQILLMEDCSLWLLPTPNTTELLYKQKPLRTKAICSFALEAVLPKGLILLALQPLALEGLGRSRFLPRSKEQPLGPALCLCKSWTSILIWGQ